jgi:hypothetical protein
METVGGAFGVTLLEAAEAGPVPAELVALTVNVYAVPLVSPVTVIGLAVPVTVWPAEDVTVYPVIVLPPLDAGALKDTVAWALPAAADTLVGAPGTVAGVTLLEAVEAGPVPTELVAVTVKVYAVPLVSPVTVMGLAVPVAVWPAEEVTV